MAKSRWYATKKLKTLRIKSNYTQKDVADRFELEYDDEISVSLYQQWETGAHYILPEHVLFLSKLFNIDYKEIVKRK